MVGRIFFLLVVVCLGSNKHNVTSTANGPWFLVFFSVLQGLIGCQRAINITIAQNSGIIGSQRYSGASTAHSLIKFGNIPCIMGISKRERKLMPNQTKRKKFANYKYSINQKEQHLYSAKFSYQCCPCRYYSKSMLLNPSHLKSYSHLHIKPASDHKSC